ncbi:MAG: hypothetical protein IKE66_08320 [Hyphomicrobium sp.]|nr:hypothetical protein [Hyphomicrobium sp.]
MLAIILSACLANDPGVCKDYKIPLSSDVDPTRCAMHAPPYFAQWNEDHPGWTIKKWRCTAASEDNI